MNLYFINIKVSYIENLNSKNLHDVFSDNNQIFIFENRIKEEFEIKKHVNLNEIESNLPFGKKWEKNRLREDVEFNFYDASRVEKELSSLSNKGPITSINR